MATSSGVEALGRFAKRLAPLPGRDSVPHTSPAEHQRARETLHKSRHSCLAAFGGIKSGHPVTT